METETTRIRRSWTLIVMAFAFATVLYAVVAFLITRSGSAQPAPAMLPTLRVAFFAAGAISLGAGILSFSRALAAEKLTPADFQVRTIVSLALCEASAIFGFMLAVLGRSLDDYIPAGLVTFAVIVLYILPRGLARWRRLEGGL